MLCVELADFPLPAGLNVPKADILFRLAPLYRRAAGQWWISPALTTASGATIPATEVTGDPPRPHMATLVTAPQPVHWRTSIDGLESYPLAAHRAGRRRSRGHEHTTLTVTTAVADQLLAMAARPLESG
ncbi:hypothetical protein, partial [Kitasatospora sp. NA04385]|uniref:hypothetical protein n=1 Tax=Kitasatospora sp. NA04385 TaxID=2742135 RepID=UPI0020CAC0C6